MGDADIDAWIDQLMLCEHLNEMQVKTLCEMAEEILIEENNVKHLQTPITIAGDLHGQFYDLMELFKVVGDPPSIQYLFMGDFVDRGYYSVETFQLLLLLKVRWPERVHLIRGNHECRVTSQQYGFYDECKRKYGNLNTWRFCTRVFDFLPLAAIVDGSILGVHGGLSPSIATIDDLNVIDRVQEVPHDGAMSDLLWSDPEDQEGWTLSSRGAGFLFGSKIVEQFNHENDIEMIARAHQLVMEGYKYMFNEALVTVWSAPNYCYRCGNVASVLTVDETLKRSFTVYEAAPPEGRNVPWKRPAPEYFL